jgi:hypothetical protein
LCAILLCFTSPIVGRADFPIPLSFDRLVGDSTIIIHGKVLRMTPLVSEDDKQIPDAAILRLEGPRCFSILRIDEHWKKSCNDDKDSPDLPDFITVGHGSGRRGRGINHDLSEERSYILFLTQEENGLYRLTDRNSVYPIVDGKVPSMGLNMLDEDVAKNDPVLLGEFKKQVEKELQNKPASASRVQSDAGEQSDADDK